MRAELLQFCFLLHCPEGKGLDQNFNFGLKNVQNYCIALLHRLLGCKYSGDSRINHTIVGSSVKRSIKAPVCAKITLFAIFREHRCVAIHFDTDSPGCCPHPEKCHAPFFPLKFFWEKRQWKDDVKSDI